MNITFQHPEWSRQCKAIRWRYYDHTKSPLCNDDKKALFLEWWAFNDDIDITTLSRLKDKYSISDQELENHWNEVLEDN